MIQQRDMWLEEKIKQMLSRACEATAAETEIEYSHNLLIWFFILFFLSDIQGLLRN